MSTTPSSSVDGAQIFVGQSLGSAGTQIQAKAQAIADELTALRAKLAPLQEAWRESQAADYYQGLQSEWDLAANGLLGPDGILGQIAHAMHLNWANYTEAEGANIQTWRH
ncbi:WXG100 family type VII secretion target [Streptomyces sp. NPDC090108]|uniref:WXG100 family type VII secretion target n=1 Tax=Streptomyces sp. NPDC090108 TaxID=3365947 RepID=UPI0038235E19